MVLLSAFRFSIAEHIIRSLDKAITSTIITEIELILFAKLILCAKLNKILTLLLLFRYSSPPCNLILHLCAWVPGRWSVNGH